MKRRLMTGMTVLLVLLSMAGCSKKQEETTSVTKPAGEITKDDLAEDVVQKTDSGALYREFLEGKAKVCTEKREFTYYDYAEDEARLYYGENDGFTITELFAKIDQRIDQDCRLIGVSYSYIDCGLDGEPELALRGEYDIYGDKIFHDYVIKNIDGKLQLCYQMESSYRTAEVITTIGGLISGSGGYGMIIGNDEAVINASGDYQYCYGQTIYQDFSPALDAESSEVLRKAVEAEGIEYNDFYLYVEEFTFEELIDQSPEAFERYESNKVYCASPAFDGPSNGVDMKQNEAIAKVVLEKSGKKLISAKEIENRIFEREKELGITKEIKEADAPKWIELKIDLNAANGIKEVTVKTEKQLLEAIGSKTIIHLQAGHYNVTDGLIELMRKGKAEYYLADGYDEESAERYQDEKCGVYYRYDEREPGLVISNISECVIRAEEGAEVVIESDPRDEDVIYLEGCSYITFENVKLVHTQGNDACSGDVLEMDNCRNIDVNGCDLAGCGATGMILGSCYEVNVKDSIIHECSVGCVEARTSYDICFENTRFEDVDGYDMFYAYDSGMTFTKCSFRNLRGTFASEGSMANMRFLDCEFGEQEEEAGVPVYIIENPALEEKFAKSSHISYPVKFKTVVDKANDITDDYEWFEENDLWSLKDEGDGEYLYAPYTERTAGGDDLYYLYIYDRNTEELKVALDLTEFYLPPQLPNEYDNGWNAEFRYAYSENGIVYISMSHATYAETMPYHAYIIAVDLSDGKLLWKSRPLSCNSTNFALDGDLIYTGYGFTAEDDFIYQIDKYTGEIINTIPIRSKAYYLFIRNDHLYVRTYNRNYEFKLIHEN